MLIGNSSCGIIEAASFKLPVVNIGTRQNNRPQSKNILNSNYSSKDIKKISIALSVKFQKIILLKIYIIKKFRLSYLQGVKSTQSKLKNFKKILMSKNLKK